MLSRIIKPNTLLHDSHIDWSSFSENKSSDTVTYGTSSLAGYFVSPVLIFLIVIK